MAIYKSDIVDINLETCNIHRAFLNRTIGSGDSGADHFGIRVFRNGEPVDLTGVSVQGIFLPPQGSPIAITDGNSVSGNEAYVVLPQACYNYDGQFCLSIKLVGGGVTGTMRIVDGMVDNTHSTGTVAPTETVPTYQEIRSTYDDMVAATAAANGAIAKPYAQLTFPVKKGDYTIVDGALKRALVDIATSETYTAAHWTDAKLGPDLSQLKSAIKAYSGFEEITMIPGYYIKTNIAAGSEVDLTPISNSSTEYAILSCSPGDVFSITARGTTAGTAVSFLDANNNVISRAEEARIYDGILISAPANSAKIVINNYSADGVVRASYKGNQNGFFDAISGISVTNGYYINYSNGNTATSSAMGVTGYIPVEPNQRYYIGFPRFYGNSCIGIYNARKQFVEEYGHGTSDAGVIITTPTTAAFIRVTVRTSMIPTVGRLVNEETLFNKVNGMKENTGTRNFSGNPLHIEGTGAAILTATISDADENTLVTACGKNIFDIPESKVDTKNGVTFTYDSDEKTIRVQASGTGASANTVSGESGTLGGSSFVYDFKFRLKVGKYVTLTSNCSEFIDYLPQVYMQFVSQGDSHYYNEDGHGYTRWCVAGFEYCVRIVVRQGWTGDVTFKPQIEFGDYPTPFEKYHGLTVAGTNTALRDLDTFAGITNIFTNDDASLSVTVSNESNGEKLEEAFDTAKNGLLLVPYISKAFNKLDEIGAHICFVDDDTSSLALVERYHDLFAGKDAVGNYAVIAKRLEDQTGLYAKLQDYEIEGFGMLFHCYDQYSEGAGNTTYFLPESRDIVECQRNVLMGLRLFEQYPFANYKYWVTPYGVNDADIQSIAKKYGFNCMMSTGNNGIVCRSNADRWNIPRCGFATSYDNTNYLKQMLDVTIHSKGMMIVTTHVNAWGSGTTYDDRFTDFLDYVLERDIKVISLPEAFEARRALFGLDSLT